ncbi:MAG: LmeA family phospholipid-binding protein [Chloroflexi bacterium]|nr:LmeA family phospholipid-binding protein [Chloroflexota bacterium]
MVGATSRGSVVGLVAAIVLWQASSCCCLGGAAAPPMTPFPVSEDLAQKVRDRVKEVELRTGTFALEISDEELTSYVIALLQSGPGDFPARDMQVQFGDGYVDIWATFIDVAPTEVPAYIRATVEVVDKQVVFHITEANAGAFPVPGALRESIAQTLSETLAEQQLGLQVAQVEIQPGKMILTGQVTGDIPDLP